MLRLWRAPRSEAMILKSRMRKSRTSGSVRGWGRPAFGGSSLVYSTSKTTQPAEINPPCCAPATLCQFC